MTRRRRASLRGSVVGEHALVGDPTERASELTSGGEDEDHVRLGGDAARADDRDAGATAG
jgi:hypothetical protein